MLFDLDGTLADTAPDLGAALNRVRRDRGLEPVPLAQLRPYASHGARGLIGAGMASRPSEPAYDALRDAFLAHYAAALCVDSALFADVGDVLDAIDARALHWGIVTNKATRYTTPLLVSLRLSPRAAAVVCGDTTPYREAAPGAVDRGGEPPGRRAGALRLRRRRASATSTPATRQACARSSRARATSSRGDAPDDMAGRRRARRAGARSSRWLATASAR